MRRDERETERDARIAIVGRRAVLEAIDATEVDVELVRMARGAPASVRSEIQQRCRAHGLPCEIGSVARVRELANDPRHDQGVAARVVLRGVRDVAQLARDTSTRSHWLALDGVSHAGNAGMIARSAVAAGIDGIVWPRTGTPWLNGLVVKASAGSVLRCPIARCDSLAEGLDCLRAAGFAVVGLCAEGGQDLYTAAVPERAVYVIGSETEGLSRPVSERLDTRITIAISGRVESLNAAVAAALVCFHVSNSLR